MTTSLYRIAVHAVQVMLIVAMVTCGIAIVATVTVIMVAHHFSETCLLLASVVVFLIPLWPPRPR